MRNSEYEIRSAVTALKKGGVILYPTDTVWGIGCDATNTEVVKKVYALKKRDDALPLVCMVSDIRMLNHYLRDIPDAALDVIAFSDAPTTIIYDGPVGFAENVLAADGTVAIRVVQDKFCRELIAAFGRPIVSTSANISGDPTPESFQEIRDEILKGADYVVNLHRDRRSTKPSTIIRVTEEGTTETIRE